MRIAVAGGTGLVGRYVTEAAARAGHEIAVLARSNGVDLRAGGADLVRALTGVDTVIDTTNAGTTEEHQATAFFTEVTGNLQRAGAEAGVRHLVVLSIVGIDAAAAGYYAAKLAHERAAVAGPVPVTVVRATQFHEFPAQMLRWTQDGNVAHVPDFPVQTVAARTVGQILLEAARGEPAGRAPDVAGPERASLLALAQRFVAHRGIDIQLAAAGDGGLSPGALLPGPDARIVGPSFEKWLAGPDAELDAS